MRLKTKFICICEKLVDMRIVMCYKMHMEGKDVAMAESKRTSNLTKVYQDKCLINKDNFVRGGGLA